ncbi:MAG TPA: cation:proton antiporter [Gaiellales bacterium]|nr:cation:proton antiporter [Gaiellales bacterium]
MTDAAEFGRVVLIVAVGFAVAILSSRISGRLRVPAPALFLAAATVSSDLIPSLAPLLTIHDVERICLVALIVILFDGGMDIGVARFRESLWPIVSLGVVGTFLVAGLLAVLVHALFGPSWTTSLLIGAALAPTDPAVVFSVLGGSEVSGRSDDILKGESGVNDPVGIALVIGLLDIATNSGSSVAIAEDFALQMAVGLAVGMLGGLALGRAMRDLTLPDSALHPLLTLAAAGFVYGLASVLHGSGFLAVFVAGVMIADLRAPYKAEIEHFHKALASLGEIVVFVALGLTIDLGSLDLRSVWLDGLAVAVLLTFVARPLVVAALLARARLTRGEKVFIAWAGMRGAVPILLAAFTLLEGVDHANRIYGIVFVVVMFSVVVQGSLVPTVAGRVGLQMRQIHQEPWDLSVRLRDEPQEVGRYVVAAGSPADGVALRDLVLGERAWISLIMRDGAARQARGDSVLRAGDEVLVLGTSAHAQAVFEGESRTVGP